MPERPPLPPNNPDEPEVKHSDPVSYEELLSRPRVPKATEKTPPNLNALKLDKEALLKEKAELEKTLQEGTDKLKAFIAPERIERINKSVAEIEQQLAEAESKKENTSEIMAGLEAAEAARAALEKQAEAVAPGVEAALEAAGQLKEGGEIPLPELSEAEKAAEVERIRKKGALPTAPRKLPSQPKIRIELTGPIENLEQEADQLREKLFRAAETEREKIRQELKEKVGKIKQEEKQLTPSEIKYKNDRVKIQRERRPKIRTVMPLRPVSPESIGPAAIRTPDKPEKAEPVKEAKPAEPTKIPTLEELGFGYVGGGAETPKETEREEPKPVEERTPEPEKPKGPSPEMEKAAEVKKINSEITTLEREQELVFKKRAELNQEKKKIGIANKGYEDLDKETQKLFDEAVKLEAKIDQLKAESGEKSLKTQPAEKPKEEVPKPKKEPVEVEEERGAVSKLDILRLTLKARKAEYEEEEKLEQENIHTNRGKGLVINLKTKKAELEDIKQQIKQLEAKEFEEQEEGLKETGAASFQEIPEAYSEELAFAEARLEELTKKEGRIANRIAEIKVLMREKGEKIKDQKKWQAEHLELQKEQDRLEDELILVEKEKRQAGFERIEKTPGFLDFLRQHPRGGDVNWGNLEQLESYYQAFRAQQEVGRRIDKVLNNMLAELGLESAQSEELRLVKKLLLQEAVERPEKIKEYERLLKDLEELQTDVAGRERLIAAISQTDLTGIKEKKEEEAARLIDRREVVAWFSSWKGHRLGWLLGWLTSPVTIAEGKERRAIKKEAVKDVLAKKKSFFGLTIPGAPKELKKEIGEINKKLENLKIEKGVLSQKIEKADPVELVRFRRKLADAKAEFLNSFVGGKALMDILSGKVSHKISGLVNESLSEQDLEEMEQAHGFIKKTEGWISGIQRKITLRFEEGAQQRETTFAEVTKMVERGMEQWVNAKLGDALKNFSSLGSTESLSKEIAGLINRPSLGPKNRAAFKNFIEKTLRDIGAEQKAEVDAQLGEVGREIGELQAETPVAKESPDHKARMEAALQKRRNLFKERSNALIPINYILNKLIT